VCDDALARRSGHRGNRGLGLETCRKLAERGHHVILTSRKLEDAERTAREIGAKGHQVEPHALDVADPESVSALAGAAPRWGKIDALVNNAALRFPVSMRTWPKRRSPSISSAPCTSPMRSDRARRRRECRHGVERHG
jgi:NAD(P)-dependent dehydrogenase (short-subunit alcohol dehydrogenase family)